MKRYKLKKVWVKYETDNVRSTTLKFKINFQNMGSYMVHLIYNEDYHLCFTEAINDA